MVTLKESKTKRNKELLNLKDEINEMESIKMINEYICLKEKYKDMKLLENIRKNLSVPFPCDECYLIFD